MPSPLPLACALVSLASLSGCLYATGGVRTFEIRTEPQRAAFEVPAPVAVLEELTPSPVEIAYARDTGRVLFKRRDVERTRAFVSDDAADAAEGYGLCLRAGKAYALLVFQRRVFEPGISQVADDAAILRRDADTAICRRPHRLDGGLKRHDARAAPASAARSRPDKTPGVPT